MLHKQEEMSSPSQPCSQDTHATPMAMTTAAAPPQQPPLKRGRPKGAAAYPETAVCIKCKVFRPKRRGYCDRCRPRNRSSSAKAAAANTQAPRTAAQLPTIRPMPASAPSSPTQAKVASSSTGGLARSSEVSLSNRKRTAPQRQNEAESVAGRTKRRRTTSAPSPLKEGLQGSSSKNSHVDVVTRGAPIMHHQRSGVEEAHATPQQTSHCMPAAPTTLIDSAALLATLASTHPAALAAAQQHHQIAILVPRPDGCGMDVVPLQLFSTAPALSAAPLSYASIPTACPSPSADRHSSSPLLSSPLSSVIAASHLMALAQASVSASSPLACSPNHPSAFSSPFSSPSSSYGQIQQLTPPTSPALAIRAQLESLQKREDAGRLPSLCSLELPRPHLPPQFRNNACSPATQGKALKSRPGGHA